MTEKGADLERFDPQATYDAAATDYLQASRRFWGFLSERTVDRLDLHPGGYVLDVASGPGWSALAAATRVGPEGRVIALDSSPQMLALAREEASNRGLQNLETRTGDMTRLDFPAASFDAVVSVLGVFFVPDMAALAADLWRLVRPGGQLAITTLGEGVFEPGFSPWQEEVRAERQDTILEFPWQRTGDPGVVRQLLADAGIPGGAVELEENLVPMQSVDDWWLVVMGSGMRRAAMELGPEAAEAVRLRTQARLAADGISTLRIPGIYAMAKKAVGG
jgi:SAM-dependent methyltransferase